MGGEWGTGKYGVGEYGGIGLPPPVVSETITISEGLVVAATFKVLGASPATPRIVEVQFSNSLDPNFTTNFDATNYSITPSLVVHTAEPGASPNTIVLATDEQGATTYSLTVATAQSLPGDPLEPPNQTVLFAGFPIAPHFFASAQSATKVVIVFSTTMLIDSAFLSPSSYTIHDFEGNPIAVTDVTPLSVFSPFPSTRATLTLASPMAPGGYYVAEVSSAVHTSAGLSLTAPPTSVFQWNAMEAAIKTGPLTISFAQFSGEVKTGLLGQPAGQLFFSPALLQDAANSIIQVDEVSLCTRAFDEYHFPQPVDPPPLFTFSPKGPLSSLGPATVLWAPAERLGLPQITVSDSHTDTLPDPVDGPCNATLVETIDITKASFLNDARWKLYPGTTTFQTASNLAPIGPGPTTVINLEP